MRGMEPLVKLRRSGYKPSVAFIDVDLDSGHLPRWIQWQSNDLDHARIETAPGESLMRIDWRPLIGMTVHVSGTDGDRVKRVAHAIAAAGAKRVIYALLRQVGDEEDIAFVRDWCYDTEGLVAPKEAHGAHVAA